MRCICSAFGGASIAPEPVHYARLACAPPLPQINPAQVTELAQQLVRLPGEAGDEQRVSEFLLAAMPALGFERVAMDANGSVTGEIEGTRAGPTLLFDAHTDTVGIAPGVPWQQAPHGAAIANGRLYGRGSTDMRGALAAMLAAAAGVERNRLAGRVVVCASVLEEVLEGVALRAVMERAQPDFVVIGEPSNLRLVHGGRGRAEIKLTAIGRPGHTSAPQHALNAVLALLPAMQAIEALPMPVHPQVGSAIIALTDIISEPYPGHSVVPSICRATYDRRLLPGETESDVLAALTALQLPGGAQLQVAIATGEYRAFTGSVLACRKWFPAWYIERSHPLVEAAARGLQAAGLAVEYGTYNFCTNGAYSAGIAAVPTIGFGPSPEALAHTVDEYVELEQLHGCARGYRAIIESVLGGDA